MATTKGILARFERVEGDLGKDAVEAVLRYADVNEDPAAVASYSRAVARTLQLLARELDIDPGETLNVEDGGNLVCPARDGSISKESHQADPCVNCSRVYHDRCFYTKAHPCVAAGLIQERKGYGIKGGV